MNEASAAADSGPTINGRNLNELLAMPSMAEINGRLTSLQKQRNDALDQVILRDGAISNLQELLAKANAQVERAKGIELSDAQVKTLREMLGAHRIAAGGWNMGGTASWDCSPDESALLDLVMGGASGNDGGAG